MSEEYPFCKMCNAMCYTEHMVSGMCVGCTRKYVRQLKGKIVELELEAKHAKLAKPVEKP